MFILRDWKMNCSSGNCYNWATFSQLFSYRNQIKLPYHELKIYRSHCEFPTAKIQWGESSMHHAWLVWLVKEVSWFFSLEYQSYCSSSELMNIYTFLVGKKVFFEDHWYITKVFLNLTNYTVLNYICLSPKSCSVAGFITLQLWYVTVTISNR